MTLAVFLIVGVLLLAALVHLALSVNEFEDKVKTLAGIVQNRYQIQAPAKKKKKNEKAEEPLKGTGGITIPATKSKA